MLTVFATNADASKECNLADEVIDIQVVLCTEMIITYVPDFLRVVEFTNGYSRKRCIPIKAKILFY